MTRTFSWQIDHSAPVTETPQPVEVQKEIAKGGNGRWLNLNAIPEDVLMDAYSGLRAQRGREAS